MDQGDQSSHTCQGDGTGRATADRFAIVGPVLDALSSHVCVLDDQGAIVYVNRAWRDFAAANHGAIPTRTGMGECYLALCDLAMGDDSGLAHAFGEGLRSVMDGTRASFELEYPCHSPEVQRWFIGRVTRLPLPDGVFTLVSHDCITHHKWTERVLEAQSERLRHISAHVPGFLACVNAGTLRYEFVNDAFERAFRIPRDRITGMHVRDVIGEANYQFALSYIHEALAGRPASYENTFPLASGTRWIQVNYTPITDAGGQVVSLVVFSYDITERKQAEAALQESEDRYRTLFEVAPDGFLIASPDGHYVDANASMCRMLGYTRDELIGLRAADIVAPSENLHLRPALVTLHARCDYHREWQLQRRDGSTFAAEVIATAMPDGRLLAMVRDISERRRMEERLHQSEKMNAIGQLAGGVAHDFNNLLTGILGYADLLAGRLEDAAQDRYARNIKVAATRAADLTNQLLAFSRKGKYLSAPVDMHKVIAEVVSLLEHSLDKSIDIRQQLGARRHSVLGDVTQLQNALLNLAVNARDAMPGGGTLTFATSVVEMRADPADPDLRAGSHLQICVTDSGTGMGPEILKHLFEPFFTTKERGKGTGLGLAAVHGVVRNHHGSIRVESQVGRGTTFCVCVPLLEASHPDEEREAAVAPVHGDARILVVDDEALVRDLAADQLRSIGYQVATCKDGEEAVAYYRQSWEHVDLVILDMVMPRMGGRETFVAMRRINPVIKAILASGHSLDGEAQGILDEGVLAFVQKPFDRAKLSQSVAEALGGKA